MLCSASLRRQTARSATKGRHGKVKLIDCWSRFGHYVTGRGSRWQDEAAGSILRGDCGTTRMKITRKFTTQGSDPFATVRWVKRSSKITNPDGSTVFRMDDAEVPETWSQLATDIMVSKYFRKAGVPVEPGSSVTGPETSARQVIHRLAGCWRDWARKHR